MVERSVAKVEEKNNQTKQKETHRHELDGTDENRGVEDVIPPVASQDPHGEM